MARMSRSTVGWWLAVALVLSVAACGGHNPAPESQPTPDTMGSETETPNADADAEARERARREEEARRRAAERERALAVIRERVHFDFDKADIRSDAEQVLQRKVAVLREYPGVQLRIEGHCDERGSNEYNLALGQRRAEAVKHYLTSYGLSPDRFTTISYGEERPLVDGHDEDAWAQNRRAEFVVVAEGRLGSGD